MWAAAIGASVAYSSRGRTPLRPSLRLIHARYLHVHIYIKCTIILGDSSSDKLCRGLNFFYKFEFITSDFINIIYPQVITQKNEFYLGGLFFLVLDFYLF